MSLRRRILIIAESGEIRDTIAVPLRSDGHLVSFASGTADTVSALKADPPDAALLVASEFSKETAQTIRSRIHQENPNCRVYLMQRVETFQRGERVARYRLDDHLLSEHELLGLVTLRGEGDAPDESSATPAVQALFDTIDVLVGVEELRNRYFAGSSHRAMRLSEAVAGTLELPAEEIQEITLANLLRDVGKSVLDEDLFDHPDEFDELRRVQMQSHVASSVRLLEHIEFPWKILPIIRHHHERYDGNGYPDGLKGPEIPLGSRILAAVDGYVAMISKRAHRDALPGPEAVAELVRLAGTQFDPEVVEKLIKVIQGQRLLLNPDQTPIVLIGDRDREFVGQLKMRLLNEGMDVRAVRDFQEVILELVKYQPQLVITHVEPDDDSVFTLYRSLREDPTLRLVPFVFTTPKLDRIMRVRALREGVDDYIVKSEGLGEIVARIENILVREATRRSTAVASRMSGISGTLQHLPLPDIVQMLNLGLKTARVTLSREEREARIWFQSGQAVHAELDELVGVDALHAMLRWEDGTFCIEHGLEADRKSIEVNTMFALMEGLRLIDEEAA